MPAPRINHVDRGVVTDDGRAKRDDECPRSAKGGYPVGDAFAEGHIFLDDVVGIPTWRGPLTSCCEA